MLSRDDQTAPRPVVLGGHPGSSNDPPDWPIWGQRERDQLTRVLESGWWAFEGPAEAEFERRFAELQTARHGLCVANGTVALQLALEALDIGVGEEVIVPGFTWQATAAAVVDVNAMPILVDADPETYCPDPSAIEDAITTKTKAIIVVHLYDSLSDMDRILEIAARHDLHVVEDCAHSHGSQWNGRGVGSVGDIGTFSFQSSKTLTAGEGGFVTTNDKLLFERLYSLRNCGRPRKTAMSPTHSVQSGNYRMTEWQSAILLAQLERFEEQMKTKERNAAILDSNLERIPGIKPMRRDRQVTRRNLYAYVFRYAEEEWQGLSCRAFRKAMTDETGLEFGAPYRPLNMSSLYRPQTKRRHHLSDQYWEALDPGKHSLPVAEHAYRHEAVRVLHQNLLSDSRGISKIPEAVERLRGWLTELLDWERGLPEDDADTLRE
ncbi:MAG: DegT/DnrJ/EryC1/StrS family aminotransferase [Actinomycetota bacterium]|nr:DegT/DnrJ/EryC1/StrS family aminotransferase [Actinomycetota bacterium]